MDADLQALPSPMVLPGPEAGVADPRRELPLSPPLMVGPGTKARDSALLECATPVPLPQALLRVAGALAGVGAYGFALRSATAHALPGLGHALWALALPGALALAWLACLPALYVFWGARQQGLGARECADAAVEGFASSGAALASTAPLLWFFAVTAPHSRILAPPGLGFVALALLAGGALFGRRLRALGADLPALVHLAFVALVAVSFAQFAHLTGIRWF